MRVWKKLGGGATSNKGAIEHVWIGCCKCEGAVVAGRVVGAKNSFDRARCPSMMSMCWRIVAKSYYIAATTITKNVTARDLHCDLGSQTIVLYSYFLFLWRMNSSLKPTCQDLYLGMLAISAYRRQSVIQKKQWHYLAEYQYSFRISQVVRLLGLIADQIRACDCKHLVTELSGSYRIWLLAQQEYLLDVVGSLAAAESEIISVCWEGQTFHLQ